MGFFGTLIKLGKAKSAEVEEKIEDANIVSFAKQDIQTATDQLNKARVGLAQTKAAIMRMEREINDKEEQIADRTSKVKKLKTDHEDLAKQQWAIKCELDEEVTTLKGSLEQYQNTYNKQKSNVETLASNLSGMKRSIERMKTMQEVKKSNDALSTIDTSSSMSAVASFKDKEKKMQAQLDTSNALMEEADGGSGDLDKATKDALQGEIPDQSGYDSL